MINNFYSNVVLINGKRISSNAEVIVLSLLNI